MGYVFNYSENSIREWYRMNNYALSFLNSKQQMYYKILWKAAAEHRRFIPADGLSVNEINHIFKAVLADTPEFFWFEGKWKIEIIDSLKYIAPYYSFDKKTSDEIQKELNKVSIKLCRKSEPYSDVYDKARIIYEWFIANVNYGMIVGKGQTIYDALVNREAVCKGLSKGYQFMLNKMNCFSVLQEGTLDNRNKHVWNIIEIQGRYYNVDISMGYDCFSFLFEGKEKNNPYRCFAVPNAGLTKKHKISYLPWTYFNCNAEYNGENQNEE